MRVDGSLYRFGPLALRESRIEGPSQSPISVGAAVYVPGWEARAAAVHEALLIDTPQKLTLEFRIDTDAPLSLKQQVKKLVDLNAKKLNLGPSTSFEININMIMKELRRLSTAKTESIFIDITSLPKSYIQSIVCSSINEGLFAKIVLGYAEGLYSTEKALSSDSIKAVDFGSANPGSSLAGPCREKRLIAILGGERANCYALIEKMGPDELVVFATQSASHPSLQDAMNAQIEKIKSVYSDRLVSVTSVEAFSMRSLLENADPQRWAEKPGVANTLFAGGTKPHAAACAIIASAREGVDLRYRRATEYATNSVEWASRYYLYEIIDLRAPLLGKLYPW